MTTWKEKMAADTARYEHLPNFIGNLPEKRAPRSCVLCGRDLDDFREGFHTYEDGQCAHRLCHELPHAVPRQRRASTPAPESSPPAAPAARDDASTQHGRQSGA